MDPIACLAFINDETETDQDRCERMVDLARWFASGGAVPSFDVITNKTLAMAEFNGYSSLAAAINVVCVNGDLSGLQGLGYKVLH